MTIVKAAPFTELGSMERRARRLFEEIGFAPALAPAADVYSTENEFVVELELPGYDEMDLAVEIADHTVAIKGARETVKEEKKKEFRLHERLERDFERRFVLPAAIDTEHLTATFAKGVLAVRAPKVTTAKPKQIPIT